MIGLVLASVLFMKSIADVVDHRTQSAPLKSFSREMPWVDEKGIDDSVAEKVFIKHLDGPLFFGFASRFQEMITALPEVKVVILRMDKVPYVDQSGLYAMEDAVMDLQALGIKVVFTDLHGQPLEMFELFNLIPGLVDAKYNFHSFEECAHWLEEYLQNNHLDEQKSEESNALT